jgi:hypothetical protein
MTVSPSWSVVGGVDEDEDVDVASKAAEVSFRDDDP